MSRLRLRGAAALCLFALAHLSAASAGERVTPTRGLAASLPLEVVLYDRTAGRILRLHRHHDELYVAGEPGHEYEIRLRNDGDRRLLAVTSIDGVNVVTGRTAAVDQPGYVLDAGASARIDGWRKSLGDVATFFFTTPRRSYAARTGRPDDVGVIGVAVFREARASARIAAPAWPPADDAGDDRPAHDERRTQERGASAAAADATSAESAVARRDRAEATWAAAPALGTGHGSRRDSPVTRTTFERASAMPDAVIRIYYDSERRLVARGVIEPPPRVAQRRPEPFPAGFVPDP